eukprot:gene6050-biopygen5129
MIDRPGEGQAEDRRPGDRGDALQALVGALEQRNVFVFLHPPLRPVGLDRTRDYFLNNLISFPTDTTIAAARLMFGGIMDAFPGLKIGLAHSGGFLPFQIGRFDLGYDKHPAPTMSTTKASALS